MACINADGSLTSVAKHILKYLIQPMTEEALAKEVGLPLFRIRMSVREFLEAKLIKQEEDKYIITDKGKEKLQ